VAHVRTGLTGPSVPLPAQGYLFDVLKNNGQHYSRDIQKSLVPRMIAAGCKWHNSVSSYILIQQLRQLTIEKGGVCVHWDALETRSPGNSNEKAVARTMAQSHAHAARNHRLLSLVRFSDCLLIPPTPCPKIRSSTSSRKKFFGIRDGLPIIDKDHPVMVEMFAQEILGTLPTPIRALHHSPQAGGYLPAILPQQQGHSARLSLQTS
jgi:hypothetical protein